MIKRKILKPIEKELASDKIIVLTGMRQVGKTTLIRYLYQKIKDKRKLYLDLENPLNQSYFQEIDYEKIKTYLERLASGSQKELIIFLDEIQYLQNLPSVVKYLYDHFKIKFVLTGSASFYLKNLFSESLSGRKRVFELYPLDFEEFLSYKAPQIKLPKINTKVNKPIFDFLEKYLLEYLTYGGFPSVVLKNTHEEKIQEIEDIFTSYFQKEIRIISDFKKLDVMKNTMLLLSQRVGSKIDVSKIASELGVSRLTIEEYLDFLEGTYFLKRIKPHSPKLDVSFRGQAKPYLCDTGFLTKIGNLPQSVIYENLVFNLLKNYGKIYFYQTKAGAEIDFIVKKEGKLIAFETKTYPYLGDLNRLKRLAKKLKIKEYYLVSQKYSSLSSVIFPFQL